MDIQLHPQQYRALGTLAREILYGGAAGGGKSHLLRSAAIYFCTMVPGLQAYFFRRNWPDLRKNHMEGPSSFHVMLADYVSRGMVRIVEKEIRFWNGSKIFLCHLQHEKNLSSYQGPEIHLLLMDELTHFTEHMYRFLRGRCRLGTLQLPKKFQGRLPRIISGSNPGSLGHHWVKRTFVDNGEYNLIQCSDEEGGMLRQYIPARINDNPSLLKNDPDYLSRLEGLGDPVLVRALKDGDWDVVAGSMFGDVWRKDRHICTPFAIPNGWDLWRGADDGFAAPAACYWFTRNPDTKTIYVVDELYRSGMRPSVFAEETKKRDKSVLLTQAGEEFFNTDILSGAMDSGAFTDTGNADVGLQEKITRGDKMNQLGCRWTPIDKFPGSRVARVQMLHDLLAENEKEIVNPDTGLKKPGIIFFNKCVNAIRTLPTLPRDPNNMEDVDTNAEDHPFDGVTYGLQWKKMEFKRVRLGGR